MNKEQFVQALSTLRPASTFLTLRGYRNEFSELADFSIAFHINYRSALQKSVEQLEALNLTTRLEKAARQELVDSFKLSLVRMEKTPIHDIHDGYTRFLDEEGHYIKGVKMHNASTTLHLYGLVVHKRVRAPGEYPQVNSSSMTIAKDKLRYLTPLGKFRQFRITPPQVELITVQNLSLLPPSDSIIQ
jgi:hypothetical protein